MQSVLIIVLVCKTVSLGRLVSALYTSVCAPLVCPPQPPAQAQGRALTGEAGQDAFDVPLVRRPWVDREGCDRAQCNASEVLN